jgi:hypothetical protein
MFMRRALMFLLAASCAVGLGALVLVVGAAAVAPSAVPVLQMRPNEGPAARQITQRVIT